MNTWMIHAIGGVLALLTATGAFFFVFTRGALLVRGMAGMRSKLSHVYPIYSNMRLIKLVDFQPVISAILLFQYHRLVSKIVAGLRATKFKKGNVLITSCAFGNVIPRVVEASFASGARRVTIADIVENELTHARSKLMDYGHKIAYVEDDATAMKQPAGSADANVMFFLLHELPHDLKTKALVEAQRMLKPGGTLYLAEFHKPERWVLRALSWTYFTVFEPLGLALWDRHDPLATLRNIGGWSAVERTTYFCGNFQVITATKA
jgi:ubiquinone/menaquinone biosynthesis C-methylase UbiE